ncbi:hypothetical protein BMS3Abin07_01824 [bacterium BMS3Abin07]|nr:hypothetical protein BMS3Abin07_01824 [bacterium BMS3Abin07]GBE31997.1 hypothetical protein BMS3Bbin05_00905 [bacterium BMS3Bbin05]
MGNKPEITESTATEFVLVKDKSGKEYVCKLSDLQDASGLTDEVKKKCIENIEEASKDL